MTAAELKTYLTSLLAGQLGTYSTGAPAIHVGEPPSDITATGLEVRIEPIPEWDNRVVHHGVAVQVERQVRLTPHGSDPLLPGKVEAAVRRIVTALNTSNPRTVPQNESLGILQSTTILVRS